MIETGLFLIAIAIFSVAIAIVFIGFKIQKYIEIYATISDRYVSSARKKRVLKT